MADLELVGIGEYYMDKLLGSADAYAYMWATQVGCGDGRRAAGVEECDDGKRMNGDGCSDVCAIERGHACTGEPSICGLVCGDGLIVGAETCDDSNTVGGDGCSAPCAAEPGYTCAGEPSLCTRVCGDGQIGGTETCDDSNTVGGDGCSAQCAIEPGYACLGQPSACAAICGDGRILGRETCDDGNTVGGDCCSAVCQRQACSLASEKDAFLGIRRPHENWGANPWLEVRGAQSVNGSDLRRTMIGFDLAGVEGTAVTGARLILTVTRNRRDWGSGGRFVGAYALLEDFVEGNRRKVAPRTRGSGAGVTFACASDTNIANSRIDCASSWQGGSHAAVATGTAPHTNALAPGDTVSFDVTADVQRGAGAWVIRLEPETLGGRVRYHSREASDPSLRPRLEIEY